MAHGPSIANPTGRFDPSAKAPYTIDAPYRSRPASRFAGKARKAEGIAVELGFDPIPDSDYYLYGSFLVSLWTGGKWDDINVAFSSRDARDRYARTVSDGSYGDHLAISSNTYDHPHDLLDRIDFTVCQVVYHDRHFFFSEGFFEHFAQRLLVLNTVHENPLLTLLRSYKYTAKGYGMPIPELLKITTQIDSDASFEGLDVMKHSGGVIVPTI